jgi:hypothetical protein
MNECHIFSVLNLTFSFIKTEHKAKFYQSVFTTSLQIFLICFTKNNIYFMSSIDLRMKIYFKTFPPTTTTTARGKIFET